ncbi:unnamed protein product [Aphanomyces euteiches]
MHLSLDCSIESPSSENAEFIALDSPSNLYDPDDPFTNIELRLPEAPKIRVIQVDRIDGFFYKYNMFVVEISLPGLTWRIHTTTARLLQLHIFLQNALHFRQLFQFPAGLFTYHTSHISDEELSAQVETYLANVLSHKSLWKHPRVLAFLEYSALRFDQRYGESLVEGWVKMRYVPSRKGTLHGRYSFIGFRFTRDNLIRITEIIVAVGLCVIIPFGIFWLFVAMSSAGTISSLGTGYVVAASIISSIPGLYFLVIMYQFLLRHRRWMVIKPNCIAFFESVRSTAPSHVLLFQPHIAITKSTLMGNGLHWMVNGLHVTSPGAIIEVDFQYKGQCNHFYEMLLKIVSESEYTSLHKHNSFAPMRPAIGPNNAVNYAQHLVDGEETFGLMCRHLRLATDQIFITGWWITPDYPLVRTSHEERLQSELVVLLREAANRGVQVYILVYREHHLVLPNDSKFTKESLRGPNIYVLRHPDFVLIPQFWSHHEKIVVIDQSTAFVGGLDIALGRFDTPAHSLTDINKNKLWRGQDYSNPRLKDFVDVQHIHTELIDRQTVPRMPWHDVHCRLEGPVVLDVARHFILRWNFTVQKKYMTLATRSSGRHRHRFTAILPFLHQPVSAPTRTHEGEQVHCQVVRSLSPWSGGIKTEKSIQQAYIDNIAEAKRFIYIENQFFVSGFDSDVSVSNRVVEALYQRIMEAHEKQETFRVMFIMPLLPCFEGAVTSADSANLRAVMHWQYSTICRGGNSLLERLAREVPDPSQYIVFFGLRQQGILSGRVVTEQIYIHSKIMIIDDRVTIIGSANLNDRSLCGDRDSEIAVVLEDSTMEFANFNGKQCSVGHFGHRLRNKLFEEHLGTYMEDPISERNWARIRRLANANTDIYERVFQCFPTDTFTSYFNSVPERNMYEDVRIVYENQRFAWGSGWSADHLLFGERTAWSDAKGIPFDSFTPSGSWQVDVSEGHCDSEGWQYAFSFKAFKKDKDKRAVPLWYRWVRRRRWILVDHAPPNGKSLERQDSSCVDLKKFLRKLSTRSMSLQIDSDRILSPDWVSPEVEELSKVQGQLVEFPLEFLRDCDLRPLILPKNLFI